MLRCHFSYRYGYVEQVLQKLYLKNFASPVKRKGQNSKLMFLDGGKAS